MIDRRFFQKWTALTSLTFSVPTFLQKISAQIASNQEKSDKVLVMIQLGGGNDGLNTVIPHTNDLYYKARPRIAIDAKTCLKITDHLSFHPEMLEMHNLFKEGELAVISNVGYPNPNRSHFRSTDIWESASPADKIYKSGWLGRYLDFAYPDSNSILGIRIGEQPSLAFAGEKLRAATFANPKMFENPSKGSLLAAMEKMSTIENTNLSALDYVQRTGNQSLSLSKALQKATQKIKPKVDYPPFALCQSLNLVSQLIAADFPTRIFYVSHGGFDTHAAQTQKHAYLLQELSQAISFFHEDLKKQGLLDRVMGITFSEFGRRVSENKNAGTDHGAANIIFAFGGKVKPGVHGSPPDLSNLDPLGDLVHQIDFRQVFAGILKNWFRTDPDIILQGKFNPLPIIRG